MAFACLAFDVGGREVKAVELLSMNVAWFRNFVAVAGGADFGGALGFCGS
jgi:hypothetical protein